MAFADYLGKGFVAKTTESNNFAESIDALMIESNGWDWIEANEDKFVLKRAATHKGFVVKKDEDIPF